MPLIIITKKPTLSFENLKKVIKKIFKKNRGPQAVTSSIIRGMKMNHQEYKLNPKIKEICGGDTIWVNESISALKFVIGLKNKIKNLKLVVGPNLVVTPDENNGIIFDPVIDVILQPSEWTKKFYLTYKPIMDSKIAIWPAGVEDPNKNGKVLNTENYFILYQKDAPEDIFKSVAERLDFKNIEYRLIKYGSFDQKTYFSLLEKACGMIYLSKAESQGLALQEAWIRNVPTLVWDRGYWRKKNIKFEHENISCPYLTKETGITFKGLYEFPEKLEWFLNHIHNFKARDYSLQNLTDKITTRKFLDIIRSIK